MVLVRGSKLISFLCAGRKLLGFSVLVEIYLVLSVGVGADVVFVCGPKIILFLVWRSMEFVFVRVVEIDLVFVCGPRTNCF